ncbi:hypothetical protein ACWDA3_21455 [Nonomuraea rubra]
MSGGDDRDEDVVMAIARAEMKVGLSEEVDQAIAVLAAGLDRPGRAPEGDSDASGSGQRAGAAAEDGP